MASVATTLFFGEQPSLVSDALPTELLGKFTRDATVVARVEAVAK